MLRWATTECRLFQIDLILSICWLWYCVALIRLCACVICEFDIISTKTQFNYNDLTVVSALFQHFNETHISVRLRNENKKMASVFARDREKGTNEIGIEQMCNTVTIRILWFKIAIWVNEKREREKYIYWSDKGCQQTLQMNCISTHKWNEIGKHFTTDHDNSKWIDTISAILNSNANTSGT